MRRESIGHTVKVATLLCLVCSLLVSAAAVGLRPAQQRNRDREKKKNILIAAGLFDGNVSVDDWFRRPAADEEPRGWVETEIIDLASGRHSDAVDPETYDQSKAARDPELSTKIPPEQDLATIKRREKYSHVYLVKGADGSLDQVVLPIRGYGLWSTLYGFIAVDVETLRRGADRMVIRGLTYYKHGETPGLGGEVDNPKWKKIWKGKKAFDKNWKVVIEVVKVVRNRDTQVDALTGATITSRGVSNMMKFWLGEDGFAPYLKKLQQRVINQSSNGGPDG